jgi:hypothetical protein
MNRGAVHGAVCEAICFVGCADSLIETAVRRDVLRFVVVTLCFLVPATSPLKRHMTEEKIIMKAIVVRDQVAGPAQSGRW